MPCSCSPLRCRSSFFPSRDISLFAGLRRSSVSRRFAAVNLVFALAVCLSRGTYGVRLHYIKEYFAFSAFMFLVYILMVAVQYFFLQKKLGSWLPLFFPIIVLILVKYLPVAWTRHLLPHEFSGKYFADFFLGLSYMAFRLTYMVQEIRNGIAPLPGFGEYLAYAFFVPTIAIGPINPYSNFHNSLHNPDRTVTPIGRSWGAHSYRSHQVRLPRQHRQPTLL